MARGEHPPACARRWRRTADAKGWAVWQLVQTIHGCCGVSLLKAQRLARGWTARVAIDNLTELCERERLDPPQANIDLLNTWENGRARPRPDTIDRLARLYKANAVRLGLAADYCEDEDSDQVVVVQAVPPEPGSARTDSQHIPLLGPDAFHMPDTGGRTVEGEARSRAFFHDILAGSSGRVPNGRLLAEVEALRQQMDRTLASGTVTEVQMDRLDEMVLRCRREYLATAPLVMLCQLMLEFSDVRNLASQRQPGPIQCRLSHVAAMLAILSADALMKLGDIRQARAWYSTAKTAADDTGDPRLRALARAQEAMLPYYYGDLSEAVHLAREAQALARTIPCSASALAAAAEGRALARMGDRAGATTALAQAQRLFGSIKDNNGRLAFDFSEQRLYLYLSGAYAHLPGLRQAASVHSSALALCPAGSPDIDPTLIKLDQATSLARGGRQDDACDLAAQTLLALPPEQRTSIVFVRARDVRTAIPADRRRGRALRGLDDALSLEPSASRAQHSRTHDRRDV